MPLDTDISTRNREFWNEPCGSHLASTLGITAFSQGALALFDHNYFQYYDYIKGYVTPFIGKDATVMEIGLGFGSLGQAMAESGCRYTGVDIAAGPVEIMNARLGLHGLEGQAIQADFLSNDFEAETFDLVVSIGCLHHTGDLEQAVNEVERLLKPGGTAVIMVYNRFSYRQWQKDLSGTFKAAMKELVTGSPGPEHGIEKFPGCYDTNSCGSEAPFTEFTSVRQLTHMFRNFASLEIEKQNCADEAFLGRTFPRHQIRPLLGRLCGLDLYVTATKKG